MTTIEPAPEVHPTAQRAAPPEHAAAPSKHAAMGKRDRWLSALGGGALVAFGLGRRSLTGLALALAGGALLSRGITGRPRLSLQRARERTLRLAAPRARRLASPLGPSAIRVEHTVTIARPRDELYRFWRDFQNLPRFMERVERVEAIDETRARWIVKVPVGRPISWETRITEDREGELIAWRTVPPADIEGAGSVRFIDAPGGRGTEVHVTLDERPTAGPVGRAMAKIAAGSAERSLEDDLRRFKQLMETGEIPTVEGQTSGRLAA